MKTNEGVPFILRMDNHSIEVKYPNKVYWKEPKTNKLELVRYYEEISAYMMPYLINRPVTLHYYPRGIDKISFYKRDFNQPIPGLIDTFPYKEISKDKTINVPVIASKAGLVYLAAKGCVEFHTWASQITDIQHPSWAIFDLDISADADFEWVLDGAYKIYQFLSSLHIQSFAKTSGGTGIHIYVPIKRIYDFAFVKNWVKTVGSIMQKQYPEIFDLPQKGNRTHNIQKVTIDYMQNTITRNTASVYTVRANSSPTVSTPVSWDEILNKSFKPTDFNIFTVPKRIEKKGDLFKDLLVLEQELPELP